VFQDYDFLWTDGKDSEDEGQRVTRILPTRNINTRKTAYKQCPVGIRAHDSVSDKQCCIPCPSHPLSYIITLIILGGKYKF